MDETSLVSRIAQRLLRTNFPGRWLKAAGDRLTGIHSLNVGGGPGFRAIGWLNLDAAAGGANPEPFLLSPDCVFPLPDRGVKNVYCSHCLEHLDAATVDRVLSESSRVLADSGRLVVKLPDFDRILDAWRRGDPSMFTDELWSYSSVSETWPHRGVEDCLDTRAAMLFCGFWNDDYGVHYGGKISTAGAAYHGPPVVSRSFLQALSREKTPAQISAELCREVAGKEAAYHFHHRSAWSREEFSALLRSRGFALATGDRAEVLAACRDFPGIGAMKEQSMYFLAAPRGAR